MEEERRSFRVVLSLPSTGRKASAEIKVQEEIQSFDSVSPSPSVSAEKKLEKGSQYCDTKSGSSRHCIRIRHKVKRVFHATKDDQDQQPMVKKVAQETNEDQEERKLKKDTEMREAGKKKDGLEDEKPKNFRLDEAEAKENRKRGFTLALSREQIEEDFLELLGPKPPSRRSKKTSRASQDGLKRLFPCSWMESLID